MIFGRDILFLIDKWDFSGFLKNSKYPVKNVLAFEKCMIIISNNDEIKQLTNYDVIKQDIFQILYCLIEEKKYDFNFIEILTLIQTLNNEYDNFNEMTIISDIDINAFFIKNFIETYKK